MLEKIIKQFHQKKVLVIGDSMLDVYLSGISHRLCREAPVPIVALDNMYDAPGGAANTAINCHTLGAETIFLSVHGNDSEGERLEQALKIYGLDTKWLLIEPNRKTMTKQRLRSNGQLLVRFDYGSEGDVIKESESVLIDRIEYLYPKVDAIIVSDYGYGVMTDQIRELLHYCQNKYIQNLIIDAKNLSKYTTLPKTLVKPNYRELCQLFNLPILSNGDRISQILSHQEDIIDALHADTVAITLDCEGSIILQPHKSPYRTYTTPVTDGKAAGAGDTFISAFSLAVSTHAPIEESAEVAARAASIVVHKEGTSVCYSNELSNEMSLNSKYISDRITMKKITETLVKQNQKIVFTNGCFDIIHKGHISYLNQAKSLGDILIVGINTDASIQRLKGIDRPINKLHDRIHVLSALSSVDYVIDFFEDTPIDLIKFIKPTIYVKGGDYTKEKLPEAEIVEQLGGSVIILPYIENQSTTKIINKIRSGARNISSQLPIMSS